VSGNLIVSLKALLFGAFSDVVFRLLPEPTASGQSYLETRFELFSSTQDPDQARSANTGRHFRIDPDFFNPELAFHDSLILLRSLLTVSGECSTLVTYFTNTASCMKACTT
jgi:hypothetical protein